MQKQSHKNKTMIYTTECHIPIGEAVKTENGEYAIKIKKPNSPQTEVLSIGKLLSQIIQTIGTES